MVVYHGPASTWIGSFQSRGRILGDIVSPAAEEKDWRISTLANR